MSDHLDAIAAARRGDAAVKVAYPIGIRELSVVAVRRLTPRMVRVTLGGPGLVGFESHAPTEHVRLVFADPATGELRLPERDGASLRWPRPLPVSREYTVRRYDEVAGELDVDLVLHGGGVASTWAASTGPGDRIHVAGPPGGLVVPDRRTPVLLGGDLTALPAIARWLEELADDATGWAVIEAIDADDEIDLVHPVGVSVTWVHRGTRAPGPDAPLVEAVRSAVTGDDRDVFVWLAGEADTLKPLRRWVRTELDVEAGRHSITGYWRRGVADFDDD